MLHLGLGAFHRAHQAAFMQELHDGGDENWSLMSGNIRAGFEETVNALRIQNGRYTLETVTPAGDRAYKCIDSIRVVFPWRADMTEMLSQVRDSAVRILSFTVTEAGYYLGPSGRLEMKHPEIVADLTRAREGKPGTTIYGALAALLRERRRHDGGPITLLCCDNLRHGGGYCRAGLLQFIEEITDLELLAWVRSNTTSPNAMVDRITPRPTQQLRDRVRAATGVEDAVPVMSEAFRQWVIEDNFCNGRPAWEKVGVDLVTSVAPYEEAKIRILNAGHSALAWAGTLVEHQFIHECVTDTRLATLVRDFVTKDVIPCLSPSPVSLELYSELVMQRFSNAALGDTCQRVAQDSYSKLRGFIAPTICERLHSGSPIESAAVLPALYLEFLERATGCGLPWVYEDQSLPSGIVEAVASRSDPVAALCADGNVWGDYAGDFRLCDAICQARKHLRQLGVCANRDRANSEAN